MLAAREFEYPNALNTIEGDPYSKAQGFEEFLDTPFMQHQNARQKEADLAAMQEVTARLREQLRFIIHALRCWRDRHASYENTTRLRYSAYEGALCYADLRRHWAFYRHAMQEFKSLKIR